MPETIQIEMERLWERVKEGRSADELIEEFQFPDRGTLRRALTKVMWKKDETLTVPGLIGKASINPRYTREGYRVDPQMLEGTGEEEETGLYDVTLDQGVITIIRP